MKYGCATIVRGNTPAETAIAHHAAARQAVTSDQRVVTSTVLSIEEAIAGTSPVATERGSSLLIAVT